MFSRLIDGIMQLVMGTIRLGLQLVTFQFLPAIFFVAVWMTEQGLMLMPRIAARLHPGLVVLISTFFWSLIWLGVWMLSGWWLFASDLTLWIAVIGGLWGLAVGGTLARDWSPPAVLPPPYTPDATMGVHPDMVVDEDEDPTIPVDDLFTGGLFVGHDVRHSGPDGS